MGRRVTGKRKIREKRGTGTGADYNPWIHEREVSSLGTKSLPIDWKTGRQIHCLSRNETYWFYILRWDDAVIDINEQYPLDRDKTEQIAGMLGVRHPVLNNDPDERMTSDFYVTLRQKDGSIGHIVYSVKESYNEIFGDVSDPKICRNVEKQRIEMSYWKLQGVPFRIIFGDKDINDTYAVNISIVVNHYDIKDVHSMQEFMCWLIAHKYLNIDMKSQPIDIHKLTRYYLGTREQIQHWTAQIREAKCFQNSQDVLLDSDE